MVHGRMQSHSAKPLINLIIKTAHSQSAHHFDVGCMWVLHPAAERGVEGSESARLCMDQEETKIWSKHACLVHACKHAQRCVRVQ